MSVAISVLLNLHSLYVGTTAGLAPFECCISYRVSAVTAEFPEGLVFKLYLTTFLGHNTDLLAHIPVKLYKDGGITRTGPAHVGSGIIMHPLTSRCSSPIFL
jgi:hypothetical protein